MIHYCKIYNPETRTSDYVWLTDGQIKDYANNGYIVTILDDELVDY